MVGTLTNEYIGLGDTDADARWIGIRRHQAVLIVAGLGLLGDGVIVSSPSIVEVLLGFALLVCSIPIFDRLTIGEHLTIGVRFALRPHWNVIQVRDEETTMAIHARGDVRVKGYELHHRGRLDLSGGDVELAEKMSALMVGLSTRTSSSHVSVHVHPEQRSTSTLLTLPGETSAPEGWSENVGLLRLVLGVRRDGTLGFLERWRYVRCAEQVRSTLRVIDFTGSPSPVSLLDKLQRANCRPDIALHFDIVPATKAQRVVSRAVHQLGSDGAVRGAAGFRRTAKASRALRRLVQREELVVAGQALMRVGAFVVVRSNSRAELRFAVKDLIRSCENAGLQVQRGGGLQALWYCFQLPGGPGW